jgi:Tol biopolymer transport system component
MKLLLQIFVFILSIVNLLYSGIEKSSGNEMQDRIVYCYQSTTQAMIYTVNIDGSENKKISNQSFSLNHPDWSPDGTKIAVAGSVNQTTYSIFVMNSDGNNIKKLTKTLNVIDCEPNWSPDGTMIAFGRMYPSQNFKRELWLMNADGNNQHWTGKLMDDAAEWSPDSKRLIYSTEIEGLHEIYSMTINELVETRLTDLKINSTIQPSYSPDGNKILFNVNQNNNGNFFTMNSDGTDVQLLIGLKTPIWKSFYSPDGTLITFGTTTDEAGNHWEIFTMNSDGSDIKQVTNAMGQYTSVDPDWHPIIPSIINEEGNSQEVDFKLYPNYPNPFNPSTMITFKLSQQSAIRLDILNNFGELVLNLISGHKDVGEYSIVWNGKDKDGIQLSSGVYLCCLDVVGIGKAANHNSQIIKMILLK